VHRQRRTSRDQTATPFWQPAQTLAKPGRPCAMTRSKEIQIKTPMAESNPCGTALCKALGFLGTAILPDCDAIISGAKRERRFHATRSCTGQNARTRHPLGWGPYAVQYVLARSLILRCIVAGISIRGTCSLIPKISWRRAVLRSSHVHARSMNWDLAFN